MIYWIFSFMLTAIDTWGMLYFLDTFLQKKKQERFEKVRFVLFFMANIGIAILFHLLGIVLNGVKVVLVLAAFFLLGYIYYETTAKTLFIYLLMSYAMILLVDFLTISVSGLFIDSIDLLSEEQNYILGTISKLIQIIVVLGIRRIWKSPNESNALERKEWCMLTCIPLFSIAGVVEMLYYMGVNKDVTNIFLLLTIGLVVINFIAIYLLQDILSKSEQLRISTLAIQNAKNQIEAYHDMDALYERQRRMLHDYKNQMMTIQNLLQNKNIDRASNLVGQLTKSLTVDLSAINTNHPVVNAVLNHKFQVAKEKQIAMIFQVGDVHEIALTEEEIVILLGNLMDNAINECEKIVKEGENAVIHLKLIYENGRVILSIKNPVQRKVQISDNKVQVKVEDGHGLGLKNVENVVEKYDGSLAIECDENEFKVVVIL